MNLSEPSGSLRFFEENEKTVTVNSERYVDTTEKCFLPKIEEMDVRIM